MLPFIRKAESLLFLPAFIIYASLFRISFSLRCRICGSLLLDYSAARVKVCEACAERVLHDPAKAYGERADEVVITGVGSSCRFIYDPVAKRVNGGRVLEVGCGQGHLLSRLAGRAGEVYGFDLAPALVNIARRYVPEANFVAADAQRMPFASDSFDYVTCTEVIEHIPGDQHMHEMFRVLKPGGTAVFSVPNKNGASGGKTAGHVHYFSLDSLSAFVEKAGFKVVERRGLGLYVPLFSHLTEVSAMALRRNLPVSGPLPMEIPEWMAVNLLVVCKKT